MEAGSATYVRTDTNATTVISPTARVSGTIDENITLGGSYIMDAWTGASVDIVTAATGTVREFRHELNAGGGYIGDKVSATASYRYSTENDYWSHGGSVRTAVELFQRNTVFALDLFGARDRVGRFGDDNFEERVWNGGGRLTYTQIIDKKTLGEIAWESTRIGGFQSSPYRFVAIGGDGTCASLAPLCVPEQNPTARWRHAFNLRTRRAFTDWMSLGFSYRYYFDNWDVQSHTLEPDAAFLPTRAGVLRLRYRYYTQAEASFYRPRYFGLDDTDGFVTRDRKLSALFTHTAGVGYQHRFGPGTGETVILAGFSSAYSFFRYLAFVGLERVHVLELTASLGLEFR